MKYVLLLHVCSFLNLAGPVCETTHIVPLEFNNYKDCILQGYKSSHNTLKEIYGDRIEKENISCVLSEPQFNAGLVQTVMGNTKAATEVIDPLGFGIEPGPELYNKLIRNMAQTLVNCLK